MQASIDAGIMFVAAAGNDDVDNDQSPHYPSSYDLDGLISVAATDSQDRLASFSNYGATSVDLGAPGQTILSTTPGNEYDTMGGTSMAAPHVAGAVALLAAHDPQATLAEIKEAILYGADPVADLWGRTVTGGRLNVANALARRMGDRGDYYHFEVDAEQVLAISTSTPGDGPGQFDNAVDPLLVLYDVHGQVVASDDNGAPDGRNARLVYTAEVGGTYTVQVVSNGGSGEYVLSVAPVVSSSVVDQHLFYNHSAFDGHDPDANRQDDNAIATDKVALLPGQTATSIAPPDTPAWLDAIAQIGEEGQPQQHGGNSAKDAVDMLLAV